MLFLDSHKRLSNVLHGYESLHICGSLRNGMSNINITIYLHMTFYTRDLCRNISSTIDIKNYNKYEKFDFLK